VELSSPATLQQIFQLILPYKIPPEVAWMVSLIQEVCKGWPYVCLLAAFVLVRGYDYLQGERIHSSSGRPLLYQIASHHLTQSIKGFFARPVAVLSFQPRYPGVHPSGIPGARPRSLLASPPSEMYRQIINSSICIMPKCPPQSSEDQRDTPLCSTAQRFDTW